jgi:hypothetical protein
MGNHLDRVERSWVGGAELPVAVAKPLGKLPSAALMRGRLFMRVVRRSTP